MGVVEPYTYAIGEFATVESHVEVFIFDVLSPGLTDDPDIRISETVDGELAAEWTGGKVTIAVPSSLPTSKTSSAEPEEFTKVVMSAIDIVLHQRGAALTFGGALETPEGVGVGLFGTSGSGKSTAAFRLARERGYRLLADDLLVAQGGAVYPFPRYVNLPRDVPGVEAWLRTAGQASDQVRRWPDQVDVPRALVSESIPERVELDYVVLLDPFGPPAEAASPGLRRIGADQAADALAVWNHVNLAGWTSHPTIRACNGNTVPNPERREAVREAIAGADCYRLDSSGRSRSRSIADLVES